VQLLNTLVVPVVATLPASPTAGQVCYLTTTNILQYYNGTAWVSLVASTYLQSKFLEVTADTSTASTTFVSLLSLSVTTTAGTLLIKFDVTGELSAGSAMASFELQIDGVVKRGCAFSSAFGNFAQPNSASVTYRVTGLAAGAHTVAIFWKTSTGTLSIKPVSIPTEEHASLLVEEVSV
jgi:hypothetical protein